MVAEDGRSSVLEFQAFLDRLIGLHPELRQFLALRLGEPPGFHLVQFARGLYGIEQDQRFGCRLHVPLGGRTETPLAPDRAIEVQLGAPAQFGGQQGEQRLGGGIGGQGQQALVVIGPGEELDPGRQFLGAVCRLGATGPDPIYEFPLQGPVRPVGNSQCQIEVEFVESSFEARGRVRVRW